MLLKQLEEIAGQIEEEILTTGTVTINGKPIFKNSLSNNPYAGTCHGAIEKLILEVAKLNPGLSTNKISFKTASGNSLWDGSRHIIAEILTQEGCFLVDPTICQYLPDAKAVYCPGEKYPLPMEDISRF